MSFDSHPKTDRRPHGPAILRAGYSCRSGSEEGCGFPVHVIDFEGKTTYVLITEDRHGSVLERVIYHTTTRYTTPRPPRLSSFLRQR